LLNHSKQAEDYDTYTKEGDPQYDRMVFLDGGSIVQMHPVLKDDINYYWYPEGLHLLDESM
jgi:hypothetical protein